ncbi:hypothetical protein GCM10022381_12710 [Leifsonia kafniensis]|uniref:Uncharacterized protein n=1 Tax=Leifsonia kafniensis TaxID=475957 RepID=A0ABP7KAF5_9MICO
MSTTPPNVSVRKRNDVASRPWRGPVRRYDLFKELSVGIVVVGLVIVGLSAFLSSPDDPSVTLRQWAHSAPADFVATTTAELGGTSTTAMYGPPYNSTPDATQTLGPIDLQSLSGVRIPIDTANDFVIEPLSTLPSPPVAIRIWNSAPETQRTTWTSAYAAALAAAPKNDPGKVAAGEYGPVPALTGALLQMADGGALDNVIQAPGAFYNMDYTRGILFLGDGTYFPGLADAQHLTGDQWGVMNETGNYPGQSWLWLFSFWYQIEPFSSAPNADLLVVVIMLVLSVALMLVPFIPGVRSLPKWIPVHRLIWRDYYRHK